MNKADMLITAYYDGRKQTHTVAKWAEILNCSRKFLYQRKRLGYSDNDLINTPKGKQPTGTQSEQERMLIEKSYQAFCFTPSRRGL